MNEDRNRSLTELEEFGQEWATAQTSNNVAVIEPMLAGDFVLVGPLGFILTKEQWIERYANGDFKNTALTWDEVTVRRYGDTAVAVGRQNQSATFQGNDASGTFRVTHIYVRQNGRWLVAGMHYSPIAPPPGRPPAA